MMLLLLVLIQLLKDFGIYIRITMFLCAGKIIAFNTYIIFVQWASHDTNVYAAATVVESLSYSMASTRR